MRLTVLALLLAVVQGAWAQTDVSTEQALKEAIDGDGSNKSVKMTADIWLSSRLVIENGKEVTLDLNGHKLARSLKSAADDGNVIRVETGGTLTLKDGSGAGSGQITGGKAINGGGICNHGTLTLEGVTITDCYASGSGGGIYNAPATAGGTPATLTIKGGSVITNTCGDRGAGIFNYPGCPISMQGKVTVKQNWQDGVDRIVAPQSNLYLDGETFINVTGSLAGSDIGVSIPQSGRTITSGYKANNPSVDGTAFFSSDNKEIGITLNDNEMALGTVVTFNERSWDEKNKQVVTTSVTKACIPIAEGRHPDDTIELTDGYYVAKSNAEYKIINITGSTVHLVLADGVGLRCAHVKLEEGHTLHVYSQSDGDDQGRLDALNWKINSTITLKNYTENIIPEVACIGSGNDKKMGSLFVHGGNIHAHGADNGSKDVHSYYSGAGIGGGKIKTIGAKSKVVIYGGRVYAVGSYGGAGIGSGYNCKKGGPIIIYGGDVEATGGKYGAGIGGGDLSDGGQVYIYGGCVRAKGGYVSSGDSGAGIGGGRSGEGGQVYIYGGETYAYGGRHAAGVGGACYGRGNTLEVHGGSLFAFGFTAPAIGGGNLGNGDAVLITGGTVCAVKGDASSAIIGGGVKSGSDKPEGNGSLIINPGLKVSWGSEADAISNAEHRRGEYLHLVESGAQRVAACQNRSYYYVQIEPCNHTAPNGDKLDKIASIDEFTHSIPCRYCVDNAAEEHQLPSGSSSKCDVCGREAKDICYYLHDNDKKTPERISAMSRGSQWNVMLKDHTFYHDGNWNTVVLPFELASFAGTPLEGATVERVKEATLSTDGVLTISLEEVKAILNADGTVGQPLFVKWPKGDDVTGPRFNSVTLSSKENPYTFTGGSFQPLYKPLNITAENIDNIVFLGSDNRLGYSDAPRQLRAFHGYFHFDTVAGARAMNRAIINHGDGTTSVITPKDGRPITVDEFWYDLLGRRLDGQPTEKGLYIHKGKKIIVK